MENAAARNGRGANRMASSRGVATRTPLLRYHLDTDSSRQQHAEKKGTFIVQFFHVIVT